MHFRARLYDNNDFQETDRTWGANLNLYGFSYWDRSNLPAARKRPIDC